jgi:hypothetical protein
LARAANANLPHIAITIVVACLRRWIYGIDFADAVATANIMDRTRIARSA